MIIYQGEFGKVVLGTVSAPLPNNTEHALIDVRGTVAVKMLKAGQSDQGRRSVPLHTSSLMDALSTLS